MGKEDMRCGDDQLTELLPNATYTREQHIHGFLYMCVELVVSHIMTDSCRVMCRNDLHAYTALYGFLNLFSFAERALTWKTT